MTSDEVNMWRLASVLVFIMALAALVVGSLAYTRTNTVNNPNNIFLGSTSLTDFAATQTVKTRNILGSSLAPAVVTTAATLFNGDLNANSLTFTGQGLTLYSDTSNLYFVLDATPDTKHMLGTTSFDTLALTGVVTSVGQATSIADGAITDAMLANASVANLSGSSGATTVTGTLAVTGATTVATLGVTVDASIGGALHCTGTGSQFTHDLIVTEEIVCGSVDSNTEVKCQKLHIPGGSNVSSGIGTLIAGICDVTYSGAKSTDVILLTRVDRVGPASGILFVESITATTGFRVRSVDLSNTLTTTDVGSFSFLVIDNT